MWNIFTVDSPRSLKGCWSEIWKIGKRVGVDILSLKRVEVFLPRGDCLTNLGEGEKQITLKI